MKLPGYLTITELPKLTEVPYQQNYRKIKTNDGMPTADRYGPSNWLKTYKNGSSKTLNAKLTLT